MTSIAIVGVGETRYAKRLGRDIVELALEAAEEAARDAGIDVREIDGLVAPWAEYAARHELARCLGIDGRFFAASSLSSGAATVSAPLVAEWAIGSKLASVVLCVQAIAWGSERAGDVGRPHAAMKMKAVLELPFGWYPQIVQFAGMARRHMELYGTTEDQLAAVALAARKHASLCENAILRTPLTLEEYRSAPLLADPFRAMDCCLVNDGAAAFLVTSLERARDLRKRPVRVLGVGQGVVPGGEFSNLRPDYLSTGAVFSGPRALARAGITLADVDFVELYDNFTSMVIEQLEDLGFCKKGEGGPFVEGGRIELGGELPVNTSGGQLAQAFVLSANLVVEAVRQLRGECGPRQVEGAEVGLVTGYTGAEHATLVLARDR
ncbi:MAG: thiolase [Candidatus Binatia bacterium]|nr:MAG: thiolase [Candidatus Binatia bacterium]